MKRKRAAGRPRATPRPRRATRAPLRHAETRERLLAAARTQFVERGFWRVSVRDICKEAGANVAAVNYHFGDKLGLYREVARQAIEEIRAVSDFSQDAGPDALAEDRLRHYVRTFLPRVAKPGTDAQWIGKLMSHENAEPTPLAAWIFAEAVMPRLIYLSAVIAEILHCEPTDSRVGRCVMSIQAQCLFYRPDRFRTAVAPGWTLEDDAAVAVVAQHIVQFSLAGIRAVGQV